MHNSRKKANLMNNKLHFAQKHFAKQSRLFTFEE